MRRFFLASFDPVKNRLIVLVFIVAGALTVPVYLFHLLWTRAIGGWEWLILVGVAALTYAFYRLYPPSVLGD
ncbi:MAG: hypothetical protein M5R36_07775 [Deltaproteobacteria bacterium]|nr:hypothetical protein [Deltaproteobacteria bacterium]